MTLLDIDRHSDDRGSPMPNVHDVLSAESVAAKATQGNQYSVNRPPSGRINVTNQRILTNDGTANRLLITPTQIRVSQPGIDVTQATPAQLLLNSDQDIFKIVQTGTGAVPSVVVGSSSSNTTGIQVAHGLGAAPLALVYLQFTVTEFTNAGSAAVAAYNPLPVTNLSTSFPALVSAGSLTSFLLSYAVDANFLYITCTYNAGASGATTLPLPMRYYLLQETAS